MLRTPLLLLGSPAAPAKAPGSPDTNSAATTKAQVPQPRFHVPQISPQLPRPQVPRYLSSRNHQSPGSSSQDLRFRRYLLNKMSDMREKTNDQTRGIEGQQTAEENQRKTSTTDATPRTGKDERNQRKRNSKMHPLQTATWDSEENTTPLKLPKQEENITLSSSNSPHNNADTELLPSLICPQSTITTLSSHPLSEFTTSLPSTFSSSTEFCKGCKKR